MSDRGVSAPMVYQHQQPRRRPSHSSSCWCWPRCNLVAGLKMMRQYPHNVHGDRCDVALCNQRGIRRDIRTETAPVTIDAATHGNRNNHLHATTRGNGTAPSPHLKSAQTTTTFLHHGNGRRCVISSCLIRGSLAARGCSWDPWPVPTGMCVGTRL